MDKDIPATDSQDAAPKGLSAEEQEMADGHRYQSDEFRAAREAGKPGADRKKLGFKDGKSGAKGDKKLSKDKGGKDGGKFAKEPAKTERIAKTLARAGLASRREVERLIGLGKIAVNGRILETPAVLVSNADVITVEGQVIGKAEPTRLWRYHKPVGLVTTHRDPQGRPTVFDKLPEPLPRVISVGRLDLNSEGLLLLTNDGELARALELPSSGWMRRYRARALGNTTQARLDALKDGTTVEGVIYGPIEATLDKMVDKPDGRANVWITIGITEGKNREVRKVLESIGLKVNRLIRLAYGPFQLGNLEPGDVEEVGPRVIRELLSDMIDPRNLPLEGASQPLDRPAPGGSRFSRDKTTAEGARSPERRGGANRFADTGFADKPRPKRAMAEKREFKDRDFDERPRFEGDGSPRDRRPEGEAPRRSYDKKPFASSGAPSGDRKPYNRPSDGKPRFDRSASGEGGGERKTYGKPRSDAGGGDRPRSFGDKPRFDRGASGEGGGERKTYGKPRSDAGGGDRPRSFGDKPRFDRGASGEGGGERKTYAKPRSDAGGGDRPRSYSDKPRFDRGASGEGGGERKTYGKPRSDAGGGDRPRSYSDKPRFDRGASGEGGGERKTYAKPRSDAGGGDRPRSFGDKPRFDRGASGEGGGERKTYGKPRSDAGGGDRPRSYGDKPAGKSFGGKPAYGKPAGSRPAGAKPFDRKPPRDRG